MPVELGSRRPGGRYIRRGGAPVFYLQLTRIRFRLSVIRFYNKVAFKKNRNEGRHL
jgi:hypothetical protein